MFASHLQSNQLQPLLLPSVDRTMTNVFVRCPFVIQSSPSFVRTPLCFRLLVANHMLVFCGHMQTRETGSKGQTKWKPPLVVVWLDANQMCIEMNGMHMQCTFVDKCGQSSSFYHLPQVQLQLACRCKIFVVSNNHKRGIGINDISNEWPLGWPQMNGTYISVFFLASFQRAQCPLEPSCALTLTSLRVFIGPFLYYVLLSMLVTLSEVFVMHSPYHVVNTKTQPCNNWSYYWHNRYHCNC